MTTPVLARPAPTSAADTPDTAELRARFAPVFARIAANEARRRDTAVAPHAAVRLLAETGFTALRLPRERGGSGATLTQLLDLLVDLAAADANLPQALHGHFMFTEQVARDVHPRLTDWWLDEVAAGKVFANALVDPPAATGLPGVTARRDPRDPEAFLLTGTKQYSTGTLLADWTLVAAHDDAGALQPLVVEVAGPGVEARDDWDGIGQRGTASGTTVYTDAPAPAWRRVDLERPAAAPGYPFLWLILAATQAGIAQRALDDFTEILRRRSRSYQHAASASPAHDPVLQHQLGAAAAQVRALRSVVLGAVPALEAAYTAAAGAAPAIGAVESASPDDGAAEAFEAAHTEAWVAAASASSVAADLTLRLTSDLFETAGASAVVAGPGLDRHWRNARVLASHTPLPHRRRQIGECLLHGTPAPHSADAVETASSAGADPSRDSASPSPSTPAAPKEQ